MTDPERTAQSGRRHIVLVAIILTVVIVVVIVVVIAVGVVYARGHSRATTAPTTLPTTVPTSPVAAPAVACSAGVQAVPTSQVPTDVAAWTKDPVIGTGSLWTREAAIHVAGTHQTFGWLLKFPWYTRPNGLLTISAHRLDGPGTFRYDVNQAFDARGAWNTSSLVFSTPGCWEVQGRYKTSTLQFRVRIGTA